MLKNTIAIICFTCLILAQDDTIDPVFTGAFGSSTINDKLYNQFSIRPEFAFSKVAVGLDLYFYFDENGDFYEDVSYESGAESGDINLDGSNDVLDVVLLTNCIILDNCDE